MVAEKTYSPVSGWIPLIVTLGMLVGGPWLIISKAVALGSYGGSQHLLLMIGGIMITVFGVISIFGFMAVPPNQGRVLLLFGKYKGSVLESGFFWVNPFFTKKRISLRIRNFETGSIHQPEEKGPQGKVIKAKTRTSGRPSKVNDRDGNPIDISAVVVWRVVNTAEALFEVDDFEDFVAVQSEAALRNMASRHPYDSSDDEISLRGSTDDICKQLESDIQERLDKAGVEVIEARISHLAYSPEIAAAMLQRQQAQAVVAARKKIVEGAVGMVEMALDDLSKKNIIDLDDERRAAMVSNLLVVLCSDRHTQPVVNTGTLYT